LLDFSFQLPCVTFFRLKNDIPAVDVSGDLLESHHLETLFKRTHADHVVAADVDAAQKRNKYIETRFRFFCIHR
jgi:hypothetical protein